MGLDPYEKAFVIASERFKNRKRKETSKGSKEKSQIIRERSDSKASISASVELYDRMSAPLMSIMNAMNMTISSMRDMQSTMGTDMDTSSLDAATQAANQAQAAMEALNQSMHTGGQTPSTGGSEPTPTPSTDPVQVPVEWVTK